MERELEREAYVIDAAIEKEALDLQDQLLELQHALLVGAVARGVRADRLGHALVHAPRELEVRVLADDLVERDEHREQLAHHVEDRVQVHALEGLVVELLVVVVERRHLLDHVLDHLVHWRERVSERE